MRLVRLILLCLLIGCGLGPAALAQQATPTEETPAMRLDRWDEEAKLTEQLVEGSELDSGQIDGMRATLEGQLGSIPKVIEKAEAELAPLREQLAALGDPPAEGTQEAPEVAQERTRLAEEIATVEARQKRAGQARARAEALLSKLADIRRKRFTREMTTRGPGLFDAGILARAAVSLAEVTGAIGAETAERIAAEASGSRLLLRVLVTAGLIGAALFLLLGLKRAALGRLLRPLSAETSLTRRLATGVAVTLVRLLLPALALFLALFAAGNSGLVGPFGEALVKGLTRTALVMIGAYALGGAFFSPHAPQLRVARVPEEDAAAAHRWLMVLALVVGLDLGLVGQAQPLGLSVEALALLNTGFLVPGGLALWMFSSHTSRQVKARASNAEIAQAEDEVSAPEAEPVLAPGLIHSAAVLARIVAVFAPALAALGYFAASRFLFFPLVFSGAVIGVCILLFHVVQDAVERTIGPQEGVAAAPQRIRLIPVVVALLLFCGALPVLAIIWGADATDLANAWRVMAGGFRLGEVTISPLDFLTFLLVLSIGFVATRLVQRVLGRSVLPVTGLDAGGREAVRAGVGYIGIIVSALVAISAGGLDLSNLAIVAGALSVGIGFGLQNIVNNFVSGVILLIERPIKVGDWVELASGMGYVKQINVRSTEIETFDRASLFVPNSELIAGAVTNWTHSNLHGRLIVPVSVAYGTDPRQVEAILTEIAQAQPMLLRRPVPYVLLRRFGADALEFELRGVLRDVNWILNVTSEINFEIARRFAAEGIEIPFAQRDLHLRNAGELGQAIAEAMRGVDGGAKKGPDTA